MNSILIILISFLSNTFSIKIQLSVEENTKPSHPIGNLQTIIKNQTKDWNNMAFKSFQYNFENYDNYGTKNLIKVNSKNGDIVLQSAIDREEICQLFNNCDGSTILDYIIYVDSRIVELKINIIDINDNSPSFNPDDKQIEIPEGIARSTMYSLPVAKDKDSEKFGVKSYVLKAYTNNEYKKYFELVIHSVNKNPYLKVISDLDRESKDIFEFFLFAIDGSQNQGKCKITVKITDINDNTPQWIGLPYRQEIRECTTDNKVKHLMAEDRDDPLTEGGQIRFKMSDNSQNLDLVSRTFFISDNTLFLNNGALRSFGQFKISVVVLAIDGGGRSNETTIEVDIIDCNDHAPSIHVETAMPSVVENDVNVKLLTRITVKDQDYGINSEFNCNLNDTSHVILASTYVMDAQIGKSRLKLFELRTIADMSFDREKSPRHSVEMICVDNGQPMMSSSNIITIYIIDENDNKPKFDLEFKIFSISEDIKSGSEVGRVIASDEDASPNNVISYSIIGDEEVRNTFTVTNQGYIQLYRSIDRERIDRYEFKIVAIDSGKPSLNDSCQIRILVLDVNDCKPEIAKEHHFTIVESYGSEIIHKNLGKLIAVDKDNGYNGSLTFKLKHANPNKSPIKVLSDGRLSIYGNIDREINDRIEIEIQVMDGGYPPKWALTTVIVEVLDLNDNKPKFSFPNAKSNNFINVSLDLSLGSIIGHLKATDLDKEMNGTVDYSIISMEDSTKTFIIHPDGQIMLNEKLKLNQKHITKLTIEAKDRGTPALKEVTTLYIRYLSPKNDLVENKKNIPTFGRKDKKDDFSNTKYVNVGWSNVMMLIYFLAAAVLLIIFGIGGTFLYMWCRGQWFCPLGDSDKHVSTRELNSSTYHKNITKSDKNQSYLDMNSQFIPLRNDNSYQIIDAQGQIINYSNILKPYSGGVHMDASYPFRTMTFGGNYSDFHPRTGSPNIEKDKEESIPFNNEEMWDQPQHMNQVDSRNRTLSEDMDNMYDSHKYNAAIPLTFDNSHFTTSNPSRRVDIIQSTNDPTFKAKVNYVASSFV